LRHNPANKETNKVLAKGGGNRHIRVAELRPLSHHPCLHYDVTDQSSYTFLMSGEKRIKYFADRPDPTCCRFAVGHVTLKYSDST